MKVSWWAPKGDDRDNNKLSEEGNVSDSTRNSDRKSIPDIQNTCGHLSSRLIFCQLMAEDGSPASGVQAVRHSQKAADRPSNPPGCLPYHAPGAPVSALYSQSSWWDLLGELRQSAQLAERLVRKGECIFVLAVCGYSLCVGVSFFPLKIDYYHFSFFFFFPVWMAPTNARWERKEEEPKHIKI